MKRNLLPLAGIAVVVALISTAVFYSLVAGKLSGPAGSGRTVVVAARRIGKGAAVSLEDLKAVHWTGQPPKGAFDSSADLAGMTALDDIPANEPVTEARVASADSGAGAALGVPKGMRAMSVMVADSAGVLPLLRQGHKVDLQAVLIRGAGSDVEVRTVLENIEVLGVHPDPVEMPGRPALPVVTVLVRPSEADLLAAADAGAKVRVALRNPLDGERGARGSVTLSGVMSGKIAQEKSEEPRQASAARGAEPVRQAVLR